MRFFILFAFIFALIACDKPSENQLTIGTISGPETELVEVAKELAFSKYGIKVKIIEFNDYNLPNEALEDGSLDANAYQHSAYLQAAIKAHGYHLEPVGKTFLYPMGIYSQRYQQLESLPDNALIAIPNDPSNEGRALKLLETAGLIRLKSTEASSLKAVIENPKKLRFKELDAAQLPRILRDVDIAVLNSNFAIPAGLNPSKDAIYLETKDSPYANLIVISEKSMKKEQIMLFVKAFNSPEVQQKALELFGPAAIPAW